MKQKHRFSTNRANLKSTMHLDEIVGATPCQIDALLHRYYGDRSSDVPAYSADWETISALARQHGLGLKGLITAGGTAIISLYKNGEELKIGASSEIGETDDQENPLRILAPLAALAMLKLLVYRPDLLPSPIESS